MTSIFVQSVPVSSPPKENSQPLQEMTFDRSCLVRNDITNREKKEREMLARTLRMPDRKTSIVTKSRLTHSLRRNTRS